MTGAYAATVVAGEWARHAHYHNSAVGLLIVEAGVRVTDNRLNGSYVPDCSQRKVISLSIDSNSNGCEDGKPELMMPE